MRPVEDLQAAAKLLRERARAATCFAWVNDGAEVYQQVRGGPWIAESLNGDLPDAGEANGTYIASMHPLVGLALAELLDVFSTLPQVSNQFDLESAVKLARTYLGRQS